MRWSPASAVAFLGMGALVLGALNLAGRVSINGPTQPQVMAERFAQVAGKDAVSLGGSIGTALDFDALCIDGADYWNNGQDLFEAETQVALILDQPDPPRLFFLVTSPLALNHDNGLPAIAGTHQRRNTYRFLHGEGRWGLIAGDWRQAFLAEAMPAMGQTLRDRWHRAMLVKIFDVPPDTWSMGADTGSVHPEAAPAMAKRLLDEWRIISEDVAYFDPRLPRRAQAAMVRIADMIEASGGQLVVVSPPFIDELAGPLRQADWARNAQFSDLLDELEARGAITIETWDNRATAYDLRFFRDAAHLNAPGARRFSAQLGQDLERRGIVRSRDCK